MTNPFKPLLDFLSKKEKHLVAKGTKRFDGRLISEGFNIEAVLREDIDNMIDKIELMADRVYRSNLPNKDEQINNLNTIKMSIMMLDRGIRNIKEPAEE